MAGPLATAVRAKYPGSYDHVSDEELERAIVAKYPGSYDHLIEAPEVSSQLDGPPEQTFGRVASTTWDTIKGGAESMARLSGVPGMLTGGPWNAVKQQAGEVWKMAQSHGDQYLKAKQAEREGRILQMIGHSVAAAIPVVGPWAASIGETAGTGDIAGAAGIGIGGVVLAEAPRASRLTMQTARAAFPSRAAKMAKASAVTEGNVLMAVPPAKTSPYTLNDLRAAKPYLNAQAKTAPITTTAAFRDALDSAVGEIEGRMSEYVSAFPEAKLQPNLEPALREAFAENPRAGALEAGLKELDDLPLNRPLSLPELDAMRLQLNAENKAILKKNNYDVATARKVDHGFAAREAASRSIRDTLYDYLEGRGVEGVRQLRRDEGSIIKVRNAAERQVFAGQRPVNGSREPGIVRRTVAGVAAKGATAAGAAVGGPAGAVAGAQIGESIAGAIKGGRLTRDDLIARAFSVADDALPVYPEVPARPRVAGELGPGARPMGASPDTSYVRGEPATVAIPDRRALPPGRPPIVPEAPPDGSGRIPATLPENLTRATLMAEPAQTEDVFGLEVAKVIPKDERSFILRWLADEMRDLPYEESSRMRGTHAVDEAMGRAFGDSAINYKPRVGGTKIQEMFHAMGIKGSRGHLAAQLDRAMRGEKANPKLVKLADAMRDAWDGQRFDWDLLSDEAVAELGIRRRDLRHPQTTPHPDDMPDVYERFFGDTSSSDMRRKQ